MFFKLKAEKKHPSIEIPTKIGQDTLRDFTPFAVLDEDRLKFVQAVLKVETAREGDLLLQRGSQDPYSYFLISGRLELEAADGKRVVVEGGSSGAYNPISDLQPRRYTVRALSPVSYFTVDSNVLNSLRDSWKESTGITLVEELESVATPAESVDSFWRSIREDLERGHLILPTLPDVAFRIGRALRDETTDASRLASIIQTDPSITAKVVKTANSALYGGQSFIEGCKDAVVRLGLEATNHLVISFALKEVLRAKSRPIKQRMKALWQHSVHVAALCYVLAGISRKFNAERVLLAGLLHDIGVVPVLTYADNVLEVSENDAAMDEMISRLRSRVGSNILKKWGFAPDLVEVPRRAEDWTYDSGTDADYCDLVIVAQLHSYMGTEQAKKLPGFEYVPAFNKLFGEISPNDSLKILRRASHKVSQLKALLGS